MRNQDETARPFGGGLSGRKAAAEESNMTAIDVALINEALPLFAFTAFIGWFVAFSLKRPY